MIRSLIIGLKLSGLRRAPTVKRKKPYQITGIRGGRESCSLVLLERERLLMIRLSTSDVGLSLFVHRENPVGEQ